jgi:hypothetical protein
MLYFVVSITIVSLVSIILESKLIFLLLCFFLTTFFLYLLNKKNSRLETLSTTVGIGPSPPITMPRPKVLAKVWVVNTYSICEESCRSMFPSWTLDCCANSFLPIWHLPLVLQYHLDFSSTFLLLFFYAPLLLLHLFFLANSYSFIFSTSTSTFIF